MLAAFEGFFAHVGFGTFMIVLRESTPEQAFVVAERLRLTVDDHNFTFRGKRLPITVSIGVSARDSTTTQWEDLVKRADRALCQAKKRGRNVVSKDPG